jgi:adenine phosphoribosyltransferase
VEGVFVMKKLEDYVITIPDFPEKGIMFRDVTSILENADGLKLSIHELQHRLSGIEFDSIAGAESRGFIFGMPLAYNKGKSFIPVRKAGKLPRETVKEEYELEYGTAAIEIHKDSIMPGQRIVFVDDLLATGGTAEAAIHLIEKLGGKVVKVLFLMELSGLHGRDKLAGYDVESVITYPGA